MNVSKTLVACGAILASLATNATLTTAQTATQRNDARMSECSRYSRALVRLDRAKDELDHLSLAFVDTDDVKPKVVEIVTQLNDAQTTVRKRIEGCPARYRI